MEPLELLGFVARPATEPIVFPVRPQKSGHDEFFRELEKRREIRYSWKIGVMIVPHCEDVRISHEDFALCLGRRIESAIGMLRLLAVSKIRFEVKEWEGYISSKRKNDIESLGKETQLFLPAPPQMFLNEKALTGLDEESLASKKKTMLPILFPKKFGNKDEADFFRMLRKTKRLTYTWGNGNMYATDDPTRGSVKITHVRFAQVLGMSIFSSAEMIMLLTLSNIKVVITAWDEYLSKRQIVRLSEYIDSRELITV